MKVKSIPSAWMRRDGRRFDCGPYMSGALEAKVRLEELACRKDSLASVCFGGVAGIYHAGRESRNWVDDPDAGVPFLSSSSILAADLSGLPLISKKQVASNPRFTLGRGWTLITRSGTIGRIVYARPDMDGLACSEHVMRVVPDPKKAKPGYVYAFLSSKFGVPLVTSGTYGSIIQSIEPQHLADLPVPRLGDEVERQVHELVDGAATARTRAALLKRDARSLLLKRLSLPDISSSGTPTSFATFSVRSGDLARLDAGFHSPSCRAAVTELTASTPKAYALSELANVFTPGIFKRRYVDAPEYGYPYFSGTELFQLDAAPRGYLAKKWSGIEGYRVSTDWLLIQDAGQLGGLIGSVVRVPPHFDGSVVSNHLMRVAVDVREKAAYLFALLTSPHGYRAIIRNAFGSSIPQLDPKHIGQIIVPWPRESLRAEVAERVLEAWHLEDQAVADEREGVALVERAIEEAA